MTKKLHIFLLLFSMFLLGCVTDESPSLTVDSEQVEAGEQEQIDDHNNNERTETNNQGDKSKQEQKPSESLNDLTVHYIDANQGDATLFQYDNYTILYDAGDWKDTNVIDYLQTMSIDYIDLIIISHPHADHIGQLDKIMNSIAVGEVWMTENSANTKVFQRAVNAILESDADFYNPRVGELFDIGAMELTVLHPETLTGGLNEDSLSIHFSYGDLSFLFTGDAYKNEELMMLERDLPIEADFLQLGHHGSNTSSHPSFINAVNPSYAIYSAGVNNQYGHPHAEVINYFSGTNIELLGTDTHGTIKVNTDGKNFEIETEKDGEITHQQNDQQNGDNNNSVTKSDTHEDCIDINESSIDELKAIIHIGDSRAEELISYRPYNNIDELTKIHGIGDARLTDIKEQGLACIN